MYNVRGDACTRGTQRVAQCDGAAIHVQHGGVQLQLALTRDCLHSERLVDLTDRKINKTKELTKDNFEGETRVVDTGQCPRW